MSPSIEKTPSVTISAARPPASPQAPLEVLGVGVAVDEGLGPASRQPSMMLAWLSSSEKTTSPRRASAAIDPGVREVARAEQQRGLGPLEVRQPRLELGVDRHRAGDQPRGPRAGPSAERGVRGRAAQARMVGQPEVVVRAEQQHRPRRRADTSGPCGPLDHPQAAAQPARFELGEALADFQH